MPIPEGLDPEMIYHSEHLVDYWELSRPSKERWYKSLQERSDSARVGHHFVMTGSAALRALIDSNTTS